LLYMSILSQSICLVTFILFFFLMIRPPPSSTLFPYTTLFRSMPPVIVRLRLRASGIDVLRFYGLGNETRDTGASNFYKVKQQQYLVAPALQFLLSPSADLSVGPVLKFTHTSQLNVGSPYGVGDVGQVGAAADLHVDTRDQPRAARRGITFGFGGSYYPR